MDYGTDTLRSRDAWGIIYNYWHSKISVVGKDWVVINTSLEIKRCLIMNIYQRKTKHLSYYMVFIINIIGYREVENINSKKRTNSDCLPSYFEPE